MLEDVKLRILVVTASIDPASGGPTRSCKGLCRSLSQTGEDITLLVLDGAHPFEDSYGVNVIYAKTTPLSATISDLNHYSLVHIQGLWQWGLHKVACACQKAKVPYMISPRGMLDPWALSIKKWKKRIAMFLYQRNDLRKCAGLHVTATMEYEHVRELGFLQPCIIAPNGVQVPDVLPKKIIKEEGKTRIAIFLSRLHKGKGLLTLAEAWARVNPHNWIMRIIGPDTYGHKAEVIAKLELLGIPYFQSDSQNHSETMFELLPDNKPQHITSSTSYWQFYDEVDDNEKWKAYRSADLLVHPSVSENFGITIAEGLFAELPVICTKGTPWSEIEGKQQNSSSNINNPIVSNKCGWWIDQGVDALENALREATTCTNLALLGQNGHRLILSKYTWPAIAQTMIAGYQSILKNSDDSFYE